MSKKILGVAVMLAVVATVFVGAGAITASAQSMSLCQTVDALVLAGVIAPDKVAAAKAAAGCGVAASPAFTFTRNLTVGSTGADVTALQTKLGVNPATGYFGAITKAAVIAYQTQNGITPAAGYVGPITLAKLNYVAPVVVVPPTTGGTTGGTTSTLEGTAGDLTGVRKITTNTETTVGEGKTEKVVGAELEAGDDSDLAITSMKVTLINNEVGDASLRLDHYIDSVSIMQGTTKVATVDAADFTKVTSGEYSKSISLKNAVIKAGEKSKFYIEVSAISSISSDDDNNTWDLSLDSIRYKDAEGSILTIVSADFTSAVEAVVSFEPSTASDEVKLQSSASNPKTATIQVDADNVTDEETVLAFALRGGTDTSDVNILSIPVVLTSDGANLEDIVNDIWLEVDGTVYDNMDATTTDSDEATYTFDIDEGDLVVTAGDTQTVTVHVEFAAENGNYAGDAITASVTGEDIDAENSEGDSVPLEGSSSITGNPQTLQIDGVQITYVSSKSEKVDEAGTIKDYTLVFDVEAMDENVEIDSVLSSITGNDASNSSDDVVFTVVTPGSATATSTATLDSTASEDGDVFTVYAGQVKRFTLVVTVSDVSATGSYQVKLDEVAGSPATDVKTSASTVVAE